MVETMAHYGLDYGTDHSTHSELPSPDGPDDPETLLNIWLDELDTLTAVSFLVGTRNFYPKLYFIFVPM